MTQPLSKPAEDAYVAIVRQARRIADRAIPQPTVSAPPEPGLLRVAAFRSVLADILDAVIINQDGTVEHVSQDD